MYLRGVMGVMIRVIDEIGVFWVLHGCIWAAGYGDAFIYRSSRDQFRGLDMLKDLGGKNEISDYAFLFLQY